MALKGRHQRGCPPRTQPGLHPRQILAPRPGDVCSPRTAQPRHPRVAAAPGTSSSLGTAWSLRRDPGAGGPARPRDYAQDPLARYRGGYRGRKPRDRGSRHAPDPEAPAQDPRLLPQAPGRDPRPPGPRPRSPPTGAAASSSSIGLSAPHPSSSAAATTHIRVPALPTLPRGPPLPSHPGQSSAAQDDGHLQEPIGGRRQSRARPGELGT